VNALKGELVFAPAQKNFNPLQRSALDTVNMP
jgi:hypothetical protein